MAFVENRGQVDSRVTHYLAGPDTTVFFTPDGLTFSMDGWAVKADFVGANPDVHVAGGPAAGSVNFLTGPRHEWRTGIPAYRSITYRDPWPGVDIEYSSGSGRLKYAFHLAPGASPAPIALAYRGASSVGIDSHGSLRVDTPAGTLVDTAPMAYQDAPSGRKAIEIRYRMNGRRTVGFELGHYDEARALVIDPEVLVFGSYLGSIRNDRARRVVVDATGSAYVLGHTRSDRFPTTPGAFDTDYAAGFDAFITKLAPDGSSLVYSTFLGGSGTEEASAIALDDEGNAYIAGFTQSLGFPITPNAFDSETEFDGDGFVTKLNPQGSDLVYSSYIGGFERDAASGIAVDDRGAAYLSGSTFSSNFPVTPGAFDESLNGDLDAFMAKVDPTGSFLAYSTYLGGSSSERSFEIAIDSARRAYVTGETGSTNFPTTPGAFDEAYGGNTDVFVTKLNARGSELGYSTFLGGQGVDQAYGIALDQERSAYVTGSTASSDFPVTPGVFDTELSGSGADGFITKIQRSGSALAYSSYVGGEDLDACADVEVDSDGRVTVVGTTASSDFPVTPGAFDESTNGGTDAFASIVSKNASDLIASTFLGGSLDDVAEGLDVAAGSGVYVVGETLSPDFPTTPGSFDDTYNREEDGFVAKLAPGP